MLLAIPALAEDRMVMKHLEPKQTKTISFDAPKGKSELVVVADGSINCKLTDEVNPPIVKENTGKCEFSFDFKEAGSFKLSLSNISDNPVDCRASFNSK